MPPRRRQPDRRTGRFPRRRREHRLEELRQLLVVCCRACRAQAKGMLDQLIGVEVPEAACAVEGENIHYNLHCIAEDRCTGPRSYFRGTGRRREALMQMPERIVSITQWSWARAVIGYDGWYKMVFFRGPRERRRVRFGRPRNTAPLTHRFVGSGPFALTCLPGTVGGQQQHKGNEHHPNSRSATALLTSGSPGHRNAD
jgi:hypothetical protein